MRTNTQKHNCTNAQIRKCTIHKYKYRKPFEDQLGWDRIAKINIRASLLQGAMYTSAIIIKGKISERKVETVYVKKVFDGCHWECHVMPCFSGQY